MKTTMQADVTSEVYARLHQIVVQTEDRVEVKVKPMTYAEMNRTVKRLMDDGLSLTDAMERVKNLALRKGHKNPASIKGVLGCLLGIIIGEDSPSEEDNTNRAVAEAILQAYRARERGKSTKGSELVTL